ncbi:MAG: hypothetical protein M1812_004007 [Candelaria pacifica]|nr:MAG: hypothetical protein M1812_004007 [Candelaria pacifica]
MSDMAAPTLYLLDIGYGGIMGADYVHAENILLASADGQSKRPSTQRCSTGPIEANTPSTTLLIGRALAKASRTLAKRRLELDILTNHLHGMSFQ